MLLARAINSMDKTLGTAMLNRLIADWMAPMDSSGIILNTDFCNLGLSRPAVTEQAKLAISTSKKFCQKKPQRIKPSNTWLAYIASLVEKFFSKLPLKMFPKIRPAELRIINTAMD